MIYDPKVEAIARAAHSGYAQVPIWEQMPEAWRSLQCAAVARALSVATCNAPVPGPVPLPPLRAPGQERKTGCLTGGHVSYYLCPVPSPVREGTPPYQGECDDFIINLRMTFQEGCVFKAVWRSAAARLGNGKPGHSALYDAEKIVHYGRIMEKTAREALKNEGGAQ